jgi:hypothetical protein
MEACWHWHGSPEEKKLLLSIFNFSAPRTIGRAGLVARRADLATSGARRATGFLAGFLLTLLAVTAAVSQLRKSLSTEELEVQGEAYEKAAVAERYLLVPSEKRTVIVGSSVAKALPPEGFRPADVATIFMPGNGAMTGLEIILRSGARPQLVLVEVDFADRGVDEDLISHLFDPTMVALRRAMPIFQDENNLLNLLVKASLSHRSHNAAADRPNVSVAEWRNKIRERIDYYVAGFGHPYKLSQAFLRRLKTQIEELETRGTRVVFFFDPLDQEIAAAPEIGGWRQTVRDAFFDHQFIPAAGGSLHLLDGIHFFGYAGVQYFEYLLGEADAELDDGHAAGLVRVKQATLGGNCGGLSGNSTYTARRGCLGRHSCDIAIDPRLLEDRVRGCDKNLVVRWSCTPIPAERVSTESNVTAADRLTLSCGP